MSNPAAKRKNGSEPVVTDNLSSNGTPKPAQKPGGRNPPPARRISSDVTNALIEKEKERQKRKPPMRLVKADEAPADDAASAQAEEPKQLPLAVPQDVSKSRASEAATPDKKRLGYDAPDEIARLGQQAVDHFYALMDSGKLLKVAINKTLLWANTVIPPQEVQALGEYAIARWHGYIEQGLTPEQAAKNAQLSNDNALKRGTDAAVKVIPVPRHVLTLGDACAAGYRELVAAGETKPKAAEKAIIGELARLNGGDLQAARDAYLFEEAMQGDQADLARYMEELSANALDAEAGVKEERDKLSLGVNLDFLSDVLCYRLALGLDFCFDDFSQLICYRVPVNQNGESGTGKGRLIGWGKWQPMEDHIVTRLRKAIAGLTGVQPAKTEVKDILDLHAKDHRRDLLIEWCDALKWDGVDRCEKLLIDYFPAIGSPDFLRKASLTFTTALAARVLKPGYKFDMALALSSSQGYRKTSSLNALAPMDPDTTFITLKMDTPQAELNRMLRDSVIAELGEADKMTKAELKKFKNIMSAAKTRQRQLYKEGLSKMSFRYVMTATTNEDEFLTDPTGARRWVCFKLSGVCDLEAVRRDRDQIWAEAVHLVRKAKGEVLHYAETEAYAAKGNEEFQIDDSDVWESIVAAWLRDHDADDSLTPNGAPLTASLILTSALNKPADRLTHSDKMRVNKIMKALGYRQLIAKEKGTNQAIRKFIKL